MTLLLLNLVVGVTPNFRLHLLHIEQLWDLVVLYKVIRLTYTIWLLHIVQGSNLISFNHGPIWGSIGSWMTISLSLMNEVFAFLFLLATLSHTARLIEAAWRVLWKLFITRMLSVIGHDWLVVLKMADHGMPLAHFHISPANHLLCWFHNRCLSYQADKFWLFTFLFEAQHSWLF